MHLLSGVLASSPLTSVAAHHPPVTPISSVGPTNPFRFAAAAPSLFRCVGGRGIGVDPVRKTARREGIVLLRCLAPALVSAILTLSPAFHPPETLAQTANIERGATLFRRVCIGCHEAGGNIVQPGATLFIDDLQRNGVDSEEGIYRITYYGQGRMPGFGESCSPRGQCTFGPRLQEEEIRELARFVKLQADQGWPKIEMGQD